MRLKSFVAGFLLFCGMGLAHADVLILDNRDRITGTFIEVRDGRMVFQPEYVGETLRISLSRVDGLVTDDRIRVLLEDGTEVVGQSVETAEGNLRIVSDDLDEPLNFGIMAIRSITGLDTPPRDAVRTSGDINIGANFTSGNTRSEAWFGDAGFQARTNINRFRLSGEITRAKDDNELTRESATATSRYDHFVTERLYATTNISLTRDRFRDLRLRTVAGAGMGYQFFETARRNLSSELGVSYVREVRFEGDDESDPAGRLAIDYEERLFGDGIRLFHNQESLMSLTDSDQFLWKARQGLRFPIMADITGSIQLNIDHDRSPPPDTRRTDRTWFLTAGYSW